METNSGRLETTKELVTSITQGVGSPVVYLHGYGGSSQDLVPLAKHLSGTQKRVLLNYRAFFSGRRRLSFSDQVQEVLNHLKKSQLLTEPLSFVRYSYGSALAVALSQQLPVNVESMVLINPMPLDPLSYLKSFELKLLKHLLLIPGVIPIYWRTRRGHAELIKLVEFFGLKQTDRLARINNRKAHLLSATLHRFMWIAKSENWHHWNQGLKSPVKKALVVSGGKDPFFDESALQNLFESFSDSRWLRLPKGYHTVHLTHPEVIARTCRELGLLQSAS